MLVAVGLEAAVTTLLTERSSTMSNEATYTLQQSSAWPVAVGLEAAVTILLTERSSTMSNEATYTLQQSSLLTELSHMRTIVVSEHLITQYCISNLQLQHTTQYSDHHQQWLLRTSLLTTTPDLYSTTKPRIPNLSAWYE